MKKIVGMKWKEIEKTERDNLLTKATAVDGRTGNVATEDGECIVDLFDTMSVSGSLQDGEIIIPADAIIYDSSEGVITE